MESGSKSAVPAEKSAEEHKKKLHTKIEPFNDDPYAVDEWDDKLIPEELIQEVWQEQFSPDASESDSDEPYEFVTESGHAITLYRKKVKHNVPGAGSDEEDEDELEQIPSLADVEGGIPKAILKEMSIPDIEAAISELQDAMNFISAENLVFERTIGRMEQRDREIEAAMPIFTYKYSWELEDEEEDSKDEDDDDDCRDDSGGSEEEQAASQTESKRGSADNNEENEDAEEDEGEAEEQEDEGLELKEEEPILENEYDPEKEKKLKKKKKKKDRKANPMVGPDGKIRELCEWEDSDDEEYAGDYQAIKPLKEISVSKDKFFEGMGSQDRQAIRVYIRSYGELAPSNYDYMRHKYSKLINHAYKSKESVAKEKVEENYDVEIRERQQIFDEPEGLGDEDPDFPGFFPRSAKRLPLEYKHKYAEEENEILDKEIGQERSKAYRRENSIQVLIDTNVDAFELLSGLNEEFNEVLKHAYHPLTKRLMAEKILKFRKTIRSKILAEETKITMSLVELQKVRKKVNEQLKTQQEMGFKLQKIDFEQIRIRNNEYTNRIEKAHTELKELKLLTAGCFQVLKEQRQKLNKKIRMHDRMVDDIMLRETLMTTFQADLTKYTQILTEVQQRNNFMRKRLRAFKVPHSMEYIRFKAILYGLEEEVHTMRKRLRSMELSKVTFQRNLESIAKGLPLTSLQALNDNDEWLEGIKQEVKAKNLMCLLSEDEMNNVMPAKKSQRQMGQTPTTKNALQSLRAISMARERSSSGKPKQMRDAYDPEDDSKSSTDLTRYQNTKTNQTRQTFNRLYENKYNANKKSEEPKDVFKAKCGDTRYRRGARGNIIVDTRDRTRLSFLAKC